jgi:hypothetical protein
MVGSKLHLCLPSLLLVQYKLAITSIFISLTLTLYLSLSLCNFLSYSDELSCFLLCLSYHLSFGLMEKKVGPRWPKARMLKIIQDAFIKSNILHLFS